MPWGPSMDMWGQKSLLLAEGTALSPGQVRKATPALPGHRASQEKPQSWIFRFIIFYPVLIIGNHIQLKWEQIRCRLRGLVCKLWYLWDTRSLAPFWSKKARQG